MINSFLIENNRYLFFDLFHKNNKLILICPIYFERIDISKLEVYCNNIKLNLTTKYSEVEHEPIEILIYDVKTRFNINIFTIIYNNIIAEYKLEHIISIPNNSLAISTLFKDDYNLINIFYNYYRKQGVTNFYLYYNGKITDEIKQKFNLPGITLIEWDFIWRNEECKYPNHAQMGQLHQALYKYAKDNDKYIIFCDFDEYLYVENMTLLDYFENNKTINIFGFRNCWADTIDGKIPDKLPENIKCSKELNNFGYRSKCSYKVDDIATVSIHHPKRLLNAANMTFDNIMYHFYKWTGQDRSEITDSTFKLNIKNI